MLIGIISDIHSNLAALEAVLNHMPKPDKLLCIGDIVGYGPQPNECIQKIKEIKNITIIAGNHDVAAIGNKELAWFNTPARIALEWTQNQLTPKNKNFLHELRTYNNIDGLGVVHGSLRDFTDEYLISREQAAYTFTLMSDKIKILFIGHTHCPFCFIENDNQIIGYRLRDNDIIEIKQDHRYIVNVGSIGQPRDYDSRSSYVTFDTDKNLIKLNRVQYNIKKTQELMCIARLPQYLIMRLTMGI